MKTTFLWMASFVLKNSEVRMFLIPSNDNDKISKTKDIGKHNPLTVVNIPFSLTFLFSMRYWMNAHLNPAINDATRIKANPFLSKVVLVMDVRNTPDPMVNIVRKSVNDGFSIPNTNPERRTKTGAEDFTMV